MTADIICLYNQIPTLDGRQGWDFLLK